ncbi:MAG: hypothetical protein GF408_06675 [Candidatus Omnitrophica bacterium]|nr:hypothetical protein [Candidatus Omnitrophota bacterium]
MKTVYLFTSALLLSGFLICGCANYSANMRSVLGTNISDLEKARSEGKTETFNLSYSEAFNKVRSILESNGQTIFEADMKKMVIVAMDFPRQVDTTRVGIFFEPVSETSTTITLSSLSSTALDKAASIIFPRLSRSANTIK